MSSRSAAGPVIEAIEGRQLLSVSAAPHMEGAAIHVEAAKKVKVPPPNVVGVYSGSLQFDNGASDTLVVSISFQHGKNFKGIVTQGSGLSSKLTGKVDTSGALHVKYVGIAKTPKFKGAGVGSTDLTGNTLDISIATKEAHQVFTGTIFVSRLA